MKKQTIITPFVIVTLSILSVILVNCVKENPLSPDILKPVKYTATPYDFKIPYGFPTITNIPDDNPLTVEGIELGRYLFYDGRLSGRTHPDSLMSCATCHKQSLAFELGHHPVSHISGIKTPHVMLPMINLAWNPNTFLWNGRISRLEDLVWMGIIAPHEMNGDTSVTAALLQQIPMYPPMFEKAFGTDVITIDLVSKAIGQFMRTLVSANSKFDKYLRGEAQLSPEELSGLVLFTTEEGADCFHCHGAHGNPLFTTHLFYNNGKDTVFDGMRDRYSVTGNPKHKGAFKATTLRNIELTGPYMHDGRFETLEEVIDFYSEGLKYTEYIDPLMHHIANSGTQLTFIEKQHLLAFLKSLTDHDFISNPAFSNPRRGDPFFID